MDHAKYDDLIGHGVEVDRVREASDERAACLTLDTTVPEWGLDHTRKRQVDFGHKGAAKSRTLLLVPVTRVE